MKQQCHASNFRLRWDAAMVFRQSTKDSIISIVMQIEGCKGWLHAFGFVMRRETLLAYADAGVAADAQSSYGVGDGRSGSTQAQVVVCDGDINPVGGLPWVALRQQRCWIRCNVG